MKHSNDINRKYEKKRHPTSQSKPSSDKNKLGTRVQKLRKAKRWLIPFGLIECRSGKILLMGVLALNVIKDLTAEGRSLTMREWGEQGSERGLLFLLLPARHTTAIKSEYCIDWTYLTNDEKKNNTLPFSVLSLIKSRAQFPSTKKGIILSPTSYFPLGNMNNLLSLRDVNQRFPDERP